MKKFLFTSLVCALFFSVSAQDEKFKVVATASIFADMCKNIIGNDIQLETIVPVGGDPHLHEPTPRDAKLVADADLIIKNGLTFEGWLNELIENSGTKAKIVTLTEGVTPIRSEEFKNSTDPHAWMDVANGLIYIKNIRDALVEMNPANQEVYDFNYGTYKQQLEAVDKEIMTTLQAVPAKQRVLITSHDAFQYFGRKYGIRLEAVVGTSTEAQAQTSDMIRLNKVIVENKIPAVFVESTINPKLLKELAKSNDIKIGGELFADSLGDEESGAGTYTDMLKYNAGVIAKALSRKIDTTNESLATADESSNTNYLTWGVLALLLIGGFGFVVSKLNN